MGEPAVRLSAAVMAHPRRLPGAVRLRDRHPDLGFQIVPDPDPDGPPSALRTARLAWAAVDPGATHHLVVQDDAVLCDGFGPLLHDAIAARPDDALCLFTEWASATSFVVRLAALGGHGWAEVMEHYAPSVAAVLPAAVASAFAADTTAAGPQDDVALRAFLLREGVRAVVPVPNLVDHDPGPSLTGNDFMGARRSVCFPAAPGQGAGALLTPSVVPFFSWTDGYPYASVREDPAGWRWRRESLGAFLSSHGLAAAPVIAEGRAALTPLLGCGIPPVPLFGLWATAFSLGVQAAATGPACPDAPAAALALATMPPGALRACATAGQLAALAPELAALVDDGVRRGIAAR